MIKSTNPTCATPGFSHPHPPSRQGSLQTMLALGQGLRGPVPFPSQLPGGSCRWQVKALWGLAARTWAVHPQRRTTVRWKHPRCPIFWPHLSPGSWLQRTEPSDRKGGTSASGTHSTSNWPEPADTPRARLAAQRPRRSSKSGWSFRSKGRSCRAQAAAPTPYGQVCPSPRLTWDPAQKEP